MLIRFKVKNYLSFQNEVELSMISGKVRQHPSHVLSGGESRHAVDLLRGAVIYGANASGKSNLIKAIKFAQDLILEGTKAKQVVAVKPFKLDRTSRESPTSFEFEIRVNGSDYLYGFSLSSVQIISEWLYRVRLTTQEILFERKTSSEGQVSVNFGRLKLKSKKEEEFLEFVGMGTRPNQLFLTECEDKNIAHFQDVLEWFRDTLTVIFPDTRYGIYEKMPQDIELLGNYLNQFGTGVCGLELQSVSLDQFPEDLIKKIEEEFSENRDKDLHVFLTGPRGERIIFAWGEDGRLHSYKLLFRHKSTDSQEEVKFEMEEESDGSIRLLDILPVLYLGEKREKVFVVDELDRSLHPHLCYQLLKLFLEQKDISTQMIVTTHESNLLDLNLLRRDEIWFTEKDQQGASTLYSLEEFVPRYDKDIQAGYLFGRFGAIPWINAPFDLGEKDAGKAYVHA